MNCFNPHLLKQAGAAQAAAKGIKALAAAAKKNSAVVKAWQNSGEGLIRIKNAINTPQATQAIKKGLRDTGSGWIQIKQILDAPLKYKSPYRQNRMLRQLYGGSTFLPKEPVFLKKNTKALLDAAKKEGFGNYKVSGKYERPGDVIRFTDKDLLTGKERSYDIPYNAQAFYTTSDSLFDQLLDHSGLTNRQVINQQAGDLSYWHQMKKHLSGISKADQIRAGVWIAPEANRAAFGERAALAPTIKMYCRDIQMLPTTQRKIKLKSYAH